MSSDKFKIFVPNGQENNPNYESFIKKDVPIVVDIPESQPKFEFTINQPSPKPYEHWKPNGEINHKILTLLDNPQLDFMYDFIREFWKITNGDTHITRCFIYLDREVC